MARPFKSALTPMAQPDTAVQLSSLCGCSEGSRWCSAKTVHRGTGAAATQLLFASCRYNIASLETCKAPPERPGSGPGWSVPFLFIFTAAQWITEVHEQLVFSLSMTICKSRVIAIRTWSWIWTLSDKELVGQLFLQRTCLEFTENKLNEDREAAFGVCMVQVCGLCFLW